MPEKHRVALGVKSGDAVVMLKIIFGISLGLH